MSKVSPPKMTEAPSEVRSRIMRAIKGANTGPEMRVRRLTHGMGFRYRLHGRGLPGRPDLVFRPRCKVIFVHGCFWHQHDCTKGNRTPKTNRAYWAYKLRRNVERDGENQAQLRALGWDVLVVWECETKDLEVLEKRIRGFLGGNPSASS
ncbi:MAG: DNA mismatch endonuclease Vsr [Gammaproteobacteria bacterium]|nr:DNA mismatch endonuclease Vsr [Gammaproteobacteria bacterium]